MRTLIAFIAFIAIGATIVTILVGSQSFEGTVAEHPYESGLAWDKVHQDKARLGWQVSLPGLPYKTGKNDIEISVLDRNGRPLSDALVTVALSRPATKSQDRTYPALRGKDGRYHVSVDFPQFGYWDVRIEVKQKGDECTFVEKIFAGQRG